MAKVSLPDTDLRPRWRAALHAVGLRCTEQRVAVLSELDGSHAPLTHREMKERLAGFRWDSATIFRNLNDLCEAGLVVRIDAGDHVWRFELRLQAHPNNHAHFLCIVCRAVTCLHDVSIDDAARRLNISSNTSAVEDVLIRGRCAKCQRVPGKSK